MKITIFLFFIIVQIFALDLQQNLQEKLVKNGEAEVFIIFKDYVNFKQLEQTKGIELEKMDHSKRGKLVVNTLMEKAKLTQAPVLSFLKSKNIEHFSFWITNAISMKKADLKLLESLEKNFASVIETFELVGEDHLIDEVPQPWKKKTEKRRVEAGVAWINSPEVWDQGHEGQGITVGVIDTGVFLHDDLKNTYRGRTSGHNYNWFDTTVGRATPYDDNFHGTHCHGTVGASSTTNPIVGVAPKSQWISCKYLTARGGGTVANCIKCMQFMLAPHDVSGRNPDSDKRPDLVSNSYGGSHQVARERALEAMLAGGVEMVYAAGNSGSRCSTIGFPARYDIAMAVGSLNRGANSISSFSSRGPGLSGTIKPEISAPGSQVSSTSNRGGYRTASGTSMACPHVAGAIALLWSAHPELKRRIQTTRKILYETALQQTSNLCGSRGSPNNVFGHGTIDILKALKFANVEKMINDVTSLQ